MTSVSTPTAGALRKQRSRKLGFRLGAALLTVATGIAIGFAVTYTPVETPSVVTAGTAALDPADVGLLNHAANFGARQQAAEAAAIAGMYTEFAEGMKALAVTGQQGAISSADHWDLKQAAAAAAKQSAVDPADRGLLKQAATYGATSTQGAVDPADRGILNLTARFGEAPE